MANRVFRPRAMSRRRKTGWSRGPGGISTRSAVGNTLLGVTSVAVLDGLTLVRVRGEVLIWTTAVAATTDHFAGAVGIANFPENAVGVGITALEVPTTDADWDGWLWHSFFTVGGTGDFSSVARIPIDSKAMRKVKEGDTLAAIFSVETEGGTTVASVSMSTRVLDKLA